MKTRKIRGRGWNGISRDRLPVCMTEDHQKRDERGNYGDCHVLVGKHEIGETREKHLVGWY